MIGLRLAALPIAAALLGGCAPSDPPTEDSTASREADFVERIETGWDGATYIPPADLIDTGWTVCDLLDAGTTPEDFFLELVVAGGHDPEMVGALVGAAATSLCPEHADAVLDYAEELGVTR